MLPHCEHWVVKMNDVLHQKSGYDHEKYCTAYLLTRNINSQVDDVENRRHSNDQ